jgi:hypothetical protein
LANTVLFSSQAVPSLFLIFLGSLDCLTTVIGTMFFGASELNPIVAGLLNSSLPAFVTVKLAVTFCVGLIFILADKTLLSIANKDNRSFRFAHRILRLSYFGVVLFLAIVVANNIFVLLRIIW